MSYTLTETGKALTETQEGVTLPADYSFATVNDYVHGVERYFEELQWLCLGMWGCKPEPPKFPSPQFQPGHERIQVDHPAIALEGVMPV